MYRKSIQPIFWLFALIVIVSLACGAPAPAQPTATTEAEQPLPSPEITDAPVVKTEAPQPEVTEAIQTNAAVKEISAAKSAIIQIEAQGTFVDPEFGLVLNGAGRGSGFIIDPSGLAVTNNHVVTGAALVKVRLAGEDTWRNARVLGVSECSDLAVIDIEGEGYSYLDWYQGPIDVGMDIYIAGFPLGDPEYSLNKGIISKAKADGETNWASVDTVLEYDATSNPGNSGGPVVSDEGQVVAVHYAGNSSARQAFGISRDIARNLVERLKTGESVDTIGINGQAVLSEDGSVSGIWVSSVQSGSPADKAGVHPGDIVYMMENLVLATDGTLSSYCDILRTHKPSDTLSLALIRWSTGELLEGQLNGRELAVTGIFGSTEPGSGNSGSDDPGSSDGPNVNTDASASGDVYYSTDFESGVNDFEYFLVNGEDSDFEQYAKNGVFRTEINKETMYAYYLIKGWTFGNVRIDFRVQNKGVNTNYVGGICRYSEDGWYEVNVHSNGEYEVWLYDANSSGDRYKLLYSGGSTLIRMGKDTNDYTVVCNDDKIVIGINGTEVRTISLKSGSLPLLREGQVGLTVGSKNLTPVVVEFDDFILSVP